MKAKYFLTTCLLFSFIRCTTDSYSTQRDLQNPMKLWYDEPATIWDEALPIGNGRLGAMVYGGTNLETIQLNEETVWAGEPGNNISSSIKEDLPEIRNLIFSGKYKEAKKLAIGHLPFHSSKNDGMPYQNVGSLKITFPNQSNVTDYYRDLDIAKAVATVKYKVNEISYQRRVISSFTDDVIALEITSDSPSSISCALLIESPHKKKDIQVNGDEIWLFGITSDHENKKGKVEFSSIIKPKLTGGNLTFTDSSLVISNADKLVVYVSIATNFKNYADISGDSKAKAQSIVEKAYLKDFDEMEKAHTNQYKKYFDRVEIDLGTTDSLKNPTDIRLEQFKEGDDPQLVALYYQFGRYLLISSSQPGTQPANLQGIWNKDTAPPWDSKYTVNINTEMNYWPAEATNLTEMHQPLFDLVKEISVTGKKSASEIYGARGWNIHHNTDIWRISGVVDGPSYGLWPMGGAWLSQHLWYHYLYTGDKDFLKTITKYSRGYPYF